MATERTPDTSLSREAIGGGLPPEVFPYKSESKVYLSPQGRRLLDITFAERFYNEQKNWW